VTDALKKLSLKEQMEGKPGSMSAMLRDALDDYLKKELANSLFKRSVDTSLFCLPTRRPSDRPTRRRTGHSVGRPAVRLGVYKSFSLCFDLINHHRNGSNANAIDLEDDWRADTAAGIFLAIGLRLKMH
jgi:hypothetical protein